MNPFRSYITNCSQFPLHRWFIFPAVCGSVMSEASTHLMNDGHFLLLANVFIYHVYFWRKHHSFSEWNDRLWCADLNFSKPFKRQRIQFKKKKCKQCSFHFQQLEAKDGKSLNYLKLNFEGQKSIFIWDMHLDQKYVARQKWDHSNFSSTPTAAVSIYRTWLMI